MPSVEKSVWGDGFSTVLVAGVLELALTGCFPVLPSVTGGLRLAVVKGFTPLKSTHCINQRSFLQSWLLNICQHTADSDSSMGRRGQLCGHVP